MIKVLVGSLSRISRARSHMLRIMPLGDSITEGTLEHDSYVPELAKLLRQADIEFSFVGSRSGRGLPSYDSAIRHEGHGGWLAHHFAKWPGEADEPHERLDRWLERYAPDLVLVHVGTNDLICSYSPDDVVDAIKAIVGVIRCCRKEAKILVAKLIPLHDEGLGEKYGSYLGLGEASTFAVATRTLNDVIDRTDFGASVEIVDVAEGWCPEEDLADGIHPSLSGARKIAANWMRAIASREKA